MAKINIERKLSIINGFVEIPNGDQTHKNKVTTAEALALITGSEDIQVSGDQRSDREWLKLPSFDSFVGPASDFFKTLRDAAV